MNDKEIIEKLLVTLGHAFVSGPLETVVLIPPAREAEVSLLFDNQGGLIDAVYN